MEGICPQCQVRLDLPASGTYECERCRCRFEVAVGAPRPPAPAGAAPGAFPTAFAPSGAPGFPEAPGAPGFPTAGLEPPVGGPMLQAPCAQHPGNPASGVCERCGDFMCRLCTTPVEGRAYCPKCFDLLYNRGALQFAQRQFTLPSVTFGLGIGGFVAALICMCVNLLISIPLGIAGIVTGTKALREYRERPELPNRALTNWGIALSVLALVLSVAQIGFWWWTFTKGS